jgi:hypothetical protein
MMRKQILNLVRILAVAVGASQALAKPLGGHHRNKFDWKRNEVVFAFGDSYTYTQGQYGQTNYSWNTFQTLDRYGHVIVEEDPIILNAVRDHAILEVVWMQLVD